MKTNLRSGTKPTEANHKINLSFNEVCDIIKTSAEHGVSTLKFGTLHLEFGRPPKQQPAPPVESANPLVNPEEEISDAQHTEQTKAQLERDEVSLREEQIAHMMIENPSRAEEMLANGEIESDDFDESNDESE